MESAICITVGENSENHVGMAMQGSGLHKNGFNLKELIKCKESFEDLGGTVELINCKKEGELTQDELKDADDAFILILRNCVNILSQDDKAADSMFKELSQLKWDTTYWDVRRGRWLNKRARYNLCFGHEYSPLDKEKKSGTIISYDSCPIMKQWKSQIENMLNTQEPLEAEGNYYYDLKKTGIGMHGDGERKKVIALNVCSNKDVKREIHWQWYRDSKPIGKRIKVTLNHGDCYIMSEKATGFDWKKKIAYKNNGEKILNLTLRHCAGAPGSKYLQ